MSLEILQRLAERLGNQVETRTAPGAEGGEFEYRVIHHGGHEVAAVDQGAYVTLAYVLNIDEDDAAALAEKDENTQQLLFSILSREMLEGRSGYIFRFTEDEPPRLQAVGAEQKLIVDDETPETTQRLADGIQELVVVGIRCQQVLGQAFSASRASSTPTADVMFG